MRKIALEDCGFSIIHKKTIFGLIEVITLAYPHSISDDSSWECVDIKAISPADPPVTLEQIKHAPQISKMMLVKSLRLFL